MASKEGFSVPDNALLAKLKLRPELEDDDVVERCPNNRYIRYNEMLGRGAFKTVYKGFDEVEGIEVAWNQVNLDDAMQSSEHLERALYEVHLLRTLKHENVIKSYVSWVDDEKKTINMITELFTSGNLRQYRTKHKGVDLKAIKNWARQILRGLAYLHSHDPPIIHRDLKCDNIFVNGNHGEVKIGDLGFATLMRRPKSLIGTPEFMAPELYEEEYNELVDIYSFGLCMLELITREYPYSECRNLAQIYKKVISGIKPAGLDKVKEPQVKQLIEKCLVPVNERPSAVELLNDPFLAKEPVNLKSVNLSNLNMIPMDVDNDNEKRPSCVKSNGGSPRFPSLEIQYVDDRNEIGLRGKKQQDNSVMLTLRITDFNGDMRKIDFPFYLEEDTAHLIAQEMVEQLDLLHEDVAVIAKLIDDLFLKSVPTWKPSSGTSSTCSESSVILQSGQISGNGLAENLGGCKDLNDCDWVKISGNDLWKTISDDSPLFTHPEEEGEQDLKQEIDAIEAQYHQWFTQLHKLREAAIENAKKRWGLSKT